MSSGAPMRVSLIAALGRNAVIGNQGELPWRLPADMRFFKQTTMGHHVIMGRKTHESMRGRNLPGRTNVVVSRNQSYAPGEASLVHSLDAALDLARLAGEDEAFVIGGAQLYAAALEHADRLYLSLVDAAPPGDTHFPFVEPQAWTAISTQAHPADERNAFAFRVLIYERSA